MPRDVVVVVHFSISSKINRTKKSVEALDEELHHLSASFVVLEDELDLLDGRSQTDTLKKVRRIEN